MRAVDGPACLQTCTTLVAWPRAPHSGACTAINSVLLLQTLANLLHRRVFVPDCKWGPLSFMRLKHEALRASLPRLVSACEVRVTCGSMLEDSLHSSALLEHLRCPPIPHSLFPLIKLCCHCPFSAVLFWRGPCSAAAPAP